MLEQKELINLIADVLRHARRSRGYTLEKLADESNIDYSTVNLIENSKQNPRVYTVYKLLYALGIDITALLDAKAAEMQDKREAILHKLALLDINTLESLDELLARFDIIKK